MNTIRTIAAAALALAAVACDPAAGGEEHGTAEQPLELVLVQPDLAPVQLDPARFEPAVAAHADLQLRDGALQRLEPAPTAAAPRADLALRDDLAERVQVPVQRRRGPQTLPIFEITPPIVIITPADLAEPAPTCKATCAAQGARSSRQMISLDGDVQCVCYAAFATIDARVECGPIQLDVQWTLEDGTPKRSEQTTGYRCD